MSANRDADGPTIVGDKLKCILYLVLTCQCNRQRGDGVRIFCCGGAIVRNRAVRLASDFPGLSKNCVINGRNTVLRTTAPKIDFSRGFYYPGCVFQQLYVLNPDFGVVP